MKRINGKKEIAKMIAELASSILKPMAKGTENEIANNLANRIADVGKDQIRKMIAELYGEDTMMKMLADPVKRQKDKTRPTEDSQLLMESCGPNGSVKRRNCTAEVPTPQ